MRTRWSLERLVETASNKNNFNSIADYVEFCRRFLAFIARGLQAVIVSQNEPHYRFFQYKADGHFNITRPINSQLMYGVDAVRLISDEFLPTLRQARDISANNEASRILIRNSIYTIQQAIGATLDALPAGLSNTARKINGDLFERLIRLLLLEVGVDCRKGYSIKLCPLGGVYYCDLRPNMTTDLFLRNHIRAIDYFFCDDLARLME